MVGFYSILEILLVVVLGAFLLLVPGRLAGES